MNKLNVMQKFIAFIAACVSLVAVFALSGSGYSQWTYVKSGSALSEPANFDCGLTVWYHSATVYDPDGNILWHKNDYLKGETVTINDVMTIDGEDGTQTLTLAKSVYNYLTALTFRRAYLADENGVEICSFKKRTNEDEYLTIASGQWVLNFHDIDLSAVKNYMFKLVIN